MMWNDTIQSKYVCKGLAIQSIFPGPRAALFLLLGQPPNRGLRTMFFPTDTGAAGDDCATLKPVY